MLGARVGRASVTKFGPKCSRRGEHNQPKPTPPRLRCTVCRSIFGLATHIIRRRLLSILVSAVRTRQTTTRPLITEAEH